MSEKNMGPSSAVQAAPRAAGISHAARTPGHTSRGQIDVGSYRIMQRGLVVGELYVEGDPAHPGDEKFAVEHWCLYSTFEAPSASTPETALEFSHIAGAYANAEDFRRNAGTISGSRYIQATCHEMTA